MCIISGASRGLNGINPGNHTSSFTQGVRSLCVTSHVKILLQVVTVLEGGDAES